MEDILNFLKITRFNNIEGGTTIIFPADSLSGNTEIIVNNDQQADIDFIEYSIMLKRELFSDELFPIDFYTLETRSGL